MENQYIYQEEEELVSAFLRFAEGFGLEYSSDKPAFRTAFCDFVDSSERAGYCSAEVAAKAVLPDEYYR